MITAEKLKQLTTLGAGALTLGIRKAGYKKDIFIGHPVFVGITNGGDFCYRVDYPDDEAEPGAFQTTKVFVRYDSATDNISVDY